MPIPIAALLIPDLPVQLEQQRRGLQGLPLIIPHPVQAGVVLARSPQAAEAGVQVGMSLYQAQQMFPLARVVEPDEHAYYACHGAVQAALQAYTPRIETVGLGEFLVDLRGISRPGAGPASGLAAELGAAARAASSLDVRVGVAAGKFTAAQAARLAPAAGEWVVAPGDEARFLAPLPIGVLPNLPGEMRRRLHLLDLHTLGDLAALRKLAVLRQFGGEISGLYELARGHDPRPLNPDVPPLRLVRSLRLASPVSSRQPLLNAVQRLCWQLGKALNHQGYHAEALKLTLYAEDGARHEIGQPAKPPTSDEARLSRLAAVMLGRLPIAAPVAAVAVSVYPLRSWHLGLHQVALADAALAAGGNPRQVRFEETLQLLMHRFGSAVVRVASLLGPPVPVPVAVRLDGAGQPSRMELGGQTYFLEVADQWREEQNWWHRPLRRDCFRVSMPDGSPRKIFQDLVTGDWYLDRSWPLL